MTEITKSTEAKKDEMQVEKEKLESVKRADAAVKTMHDFTSPEVLYKELKLMKDRRESLESHISFILCVLPSFWQIWNLTKKR